MSLLLSLSLLVREFTVLVSYVKNQTFPQPLAKREEHEALLRFASGDKDARNTLIEHNLRLVAHVVKKYDNGVTDTDDLVSIGTIGLIKGIESFRVERGVRLATYAARCIENEILMHLRSRKKRRRDMSLQEPIGQDKEGNEVSLIDILGSDADEVIEDVAFRIDRESIYTGLKVLEPREREIIWARFGLPYGEEKTQREIAKAMGISRSYVSRIEKRAIEKLQEQFRENAR
ncbi:RNA polymerase sporulation sigma factor SigK [Ferroacidibacillus organovorans]|uniref:RNA polymerase sigma factor n=1 Tax=Ferroacidibacillus organovorans TaxID=1765683 RepID=A0A162RYD3_9BACL|nr:RNA polymerase sporulation sigma factor SigK [Ferroacidibacillus organovorans]KYP79362.1 RNA polymerase subunit sigma-70 [Ferroacidibacillus organovorans]OAG89933.1 RNA polymerase subunit sigma-70 [Ferroacidibacillus organovorans]OPG17439.1 RNA polymerase subunit sigma-70 [Ferroacidibacillus organovorans]